MATDTSSLPRKPIPLSGGTKLLGWEGTHTVCEESRCPNREECSRHGLATFLISGPVCTRRCSYCNIATGKPDFGAAEEQKEIDTIVNAISKLNLQYVVITAVNRDDREDGGSAHFLNLTKAIRAGYPKVKLEFLIPDFKFKEASYRNIEEAAPFVVAHNLETVPSQFKKQRPQGNYQGSLKLLEHFAKKDFLTKTALILGLDEEFEEIEPFLKDCRDVGVNAITVGQYLSPSGGHRPVSKVYTKEEWGVIEKMVADYGFTHYEVGPFVRSSYMAHRIQK